MRYVSNKMNFANLDEAANLGGLLKWCDVLKRYAEGGKVIVSGPDGMASRDLPKTQAIAVVTALRASILNDLWGLGVHHPDHKIVEPPA